MSVDPERLLRTVVGIGKAGMVVGGVGVGLYVGIGAVLVVTDTAPWNYSFLVLTGDPMLNGTFAFLGCSTVVMSLGLLFLAQISRANLVDRLVVVISAAIGLGAGTSLVRFTVPVVIEYVTT